jgi:hypothetical protein
MSKSRLIQSYNGSPVLRGHIYQYSLAFNFFSCMDSIPHHAFEVPKECKRSARYRPLGVQADLPSAAFLSADMLPE